MERRDPNRAPSHPGLLLKTVLDDLKISITQAAARLRVSRQGLHRVIEGKRAVSPEMALRIGKFAGNGADVWLRMQGAHDLWHARRAFAAELDTIQKAA